MSWTRIEYKGQNMTVGELAVLTGLSPAILRYRIFRKKMTVEQAIEYDPTRANVKLYAWNGKMLKLSEIAKETGVALGTLYNRLSKGIPLEEAAKPFEPKDACEIIMDSTVDVREMYEDIAKRICNKFGFTANERCGFRKVDSDTFTFRTEHVVFDIKFEGATATITGTLDIKNTPMICRKYHINSNDSMTEVAV